MRMLNKIRQTVSWDTRRVHHMQGAEREFVLFGSSIYNTSQHKESAS